MRVCGARETPPGRAVCGPSPSLRCRRFFFVRAAIITYPSSLPICIASGKNKRVGGGGESEKQMREQLDSKAFSTLLNGEIIWLFSSLRGDSYWLVYIVGNPLVMNVCPPLWRMVGTCNEIRPPRGLPLCRYIQQAYKFCFTRQQRRRRKENPSLEFAFPRKKERKLRDCNWTVIQHRASL